MVVVRPQKSYPHSKITFKLTILFLCFFVFFFLQAAIVGADIILEMLANVNLQKDLDLVNTRGRIVVIQLCCIQTQMIGSPIVRLSLYTHFDFSFSVGDQQWFNRISLFSYKQFGHFF